MTAPLQQAEATDAFEHARWPCMHGCAKSLLGGSPGSIAPQARWACCPLSSLPAFTPSPFHLSPFTPLRPIPPMAGIPPCPRSFLSPPFLYFSFFLSFLFFLPLQGSMRLHTRRCLWRCFLFNLSTGRVAHCRCKTDSDMRACVRVCVVCVCVCVRARLLACVSVFLRA